MSDDMIYTHSQNMFWREFKKSEAYSIIVKNETKEHDILIHEWIKKSVHNATHDQIIELKNYLLTRLYSE